MDIKELYVAVDKPDDTNPFQTNVTQKAFDDFYDTYVTPLYEENRDRGEEMDDRLGNVICTTKENAFAVGFRTAVQLLVNGGTVV